MNARISRPVEALEGRLATRAVARPLAFAVVEGVQLGETGSEHGNAMGLMPYAERVPKAVLGCEGARRSEALA